jgi:hypothetical protein
MSYHTDHYLYPSQAEVNRVLPEVLILFSNVYEGGKVAFMIKVDEVKVVEEGTIIISNVEHGPLNVWHEEESLANVLHKDLRITVVGISHIETKGFVEAELIQPHFNLLVVNIVTLIGLAFLIYYARPFWVDLLKRWKFA